MGLRYNFEFLLRNQISCPNKLKDIVLPDYHKMKIYVYEFLKLNIQLLRKIILILW